MPEEWKPPEGHLLTIERARELLAGDLGDVYRTILSGSCAPIYWHRPDSHGSAKILHNGTLTFIQTPKRLLGVTAAHVIKQYRKDQNEKAVQLQVMDAALDPPELIAISDKLDLAILDISEGLLSKIGKTIVPLSSWPPRLPQEDRGIMLAGYPGVERLVIGPREVNFGLFTALCIARRVIGSQITWRVDREWGTGDLPQSHNLGGISGGPLIGWFVTASGLTQYVLSGIITEAHQELENVVAIRADYISEDGSIFEP